MRDTSFYQVGKLVFVHQLASLTDLLTKRSKSGDGTYILPSSYYSRNPTDSWLHCSRRRRLLLKTTPATMDVRACLDHFGAWPTALSTAELFALFIFFQHYFV